jgi:hypothetical protein
LVYNRIKPAIDWITGTEKRTRFDFKVLARRDEESETAERKLIKPLLIGQGKLASLLERLN